MKLRNYLMPREMLGLATLSNILFYGHYFIGWSLCESHHFM